MKRKLIMVIAVYAVLALAGCRQATMISYNVSKEADNFNVTRRLTVINTRTDKCILQMVGKMSIEDQSDGIAVLVEVDRENGLYQKHYVYMNEWTMYTVEDISGINVSKYAYELEFMPESLMPVKITMNESRQNMEEEASDGETR